MLANISSLRQMNSHLQVRLRPFVAVSADAMCAHRCGVWDVSLEYDQIWGDIEGVPQLEEVYRHAQGIGEIANGNELHVVTVS